LLPEILGCDRLSGKCRRKHAQISNSSWLARAYGGGREILKPLVTRPALRRAAGEAGQIDTGGTQWE
jgi:hypothetical protein